MTAIAVKKHKGKVIFMTSHDLLMLVTLLTPGILLSVMIMATFAAGG
jgi:hypothetical protein